MYGDAIFWCVDQTVAKACRLSPPKYPPVVSFGMRNSTFVQNRGLKFSVGYFLRGSIDRDREGRRELARLVFSSWRLVRYSLDNFG